MPAVPDDTYPEPPTNLSFERLTAAAMRWTRTGNLHAATAAIQATLHHANAPAQRTAVAAGNENSVVDIPARKLTEGQTGLL